MPLQRILVGYDDSPTARHALERVAELARTDGVTVSVVSVAPVRFTSFGPVRPEDATIAEHARQAEEAASFLRGRRVKAAGVAREGVPADVILGEASTLGADLIVVGSGRKNVAERIVHGSVSERVVREADCDVLVVR